MTADSSISTISQAESQQNRSIIASLIARLNAGEQDELLDACEQLTSRQPDHPAALYGIAALAIKLGHQKIACDSLMRAHERDPHEPLFAEALAVLFAMAGNVQDATYFAKLSASLGLDQNALELLPAALPPLTQALSTIKSAPLLGSAQTLAAARIHDKAVDFFDVHLTFFPDDVVATRGLARSLLAIGQPVRALACLTEQQRHGEQATAADYGLLGGAHAALGEAAAATEWYRKAAALEDYEIDIGSAEICDALLDPEQDEPGLRALSAAWAAALPQRPRPAVTPPGDRQLRVGFLVSAVQDARNLAVVAALLKATETKQVRRFVFGHGSADDSANAGLRPGADLWRDISECDPFTLAAIIQGDEIDVVVDTGGHAAPVQLAALSLRPAPWQVCWLGTPVSPGVAAIDAELIDGFELSGNTAASGPPRHLALAAGVYALDGSLPVPRLWPAAETGALTFGSEVQLAQLHPDLLAAWARLLARAPGSTLVLRDLGFADANLVDRLVQRFASTGIADRIDVIAGDAEEFYRQIDIGLAPFVESHPHTTLEALSQGVPVVALAGAGRQRRQSAALLRRAGLDALVADDVEGYIARAADLAASNAAWSAAASAVAQAQIEAPLFQPAMVAAGFYDALHQLMTAPA